MFKNILLEKPCSRMPPVPIILYSVQDVVYFIIAVFCAYLFNLYVNAMCCYEVFKNSLQIYRSGTKRPLGTSTPTSSNALATQLYRTSSFNSTGRSSTGDPEEMYSDGSLEDEVIDLTQKVTS